MFTRVRRDDTGIAMIMVLGVIMVMTLLVGTAIAYAMAVKPQAKRDQDWNAALAAAGAGVDDFVARVNKSDSYVLAVDCTNLAWKGPSTGTNSCGWSSSTAVGWLPVQAGKPAAGQFHYDVDTSSFFKDGSVRLNSTGKVNGVSRTLQVRLSRGGPVDFLYSTDFEDADPANTYVYPGGATVECGGTGTTNAKYWWQGGPRKTSGTCTEITFIGGDVLDGPVHFNDTPLMSSGSGGSRPLFKQGYETADPACPVGGATTSGGVGTDAFDGKCWRNTSNTNPQFANGTTAVGVGIRSMIDTSDQFTTFPGCLYTGDTRIRFNSNGTMTVWNTLSSGTAILGPDTPAGTNCGNASNFRPAVGQTYPDAGQTVPVPNDMIIYVQNSPVSQTCTPGQVVNGTASGSSSGDVIPLGSGTTIADNVDISYFNPSSVASVTSKTYRRSSSKWSLQSTTGPTSTTSGDTHPVTFDCGTGNLYLEGTLNSRVTVAAQNNIIVTGDLLLAGTAAGSQPTGTPMLGLVAANSVVVYHPVDRGSSTSTSTSKSPSSKSGNCPSSSTSTSMPTSGSGGTYTITCTWTSTTTYNSTYDDLSYPNASTGSSSKRWIYGSIQTLQHSFWVSNYNKGSNLGTLAVRGSIAQRWRGIVGTGSGSTGYYKDYSYDTRLKFSSPPYFPQWNNAIWGAKTTGELTPQY